MKFKFSPLALALVLMLCFTLDVRAHGPFDNSSMLIVYDDKLEVIVTMGMDGSRHFLQNAGLSEADAATALASRGPSSQAGLSTELAPKFFEVNVDGKALVASGVSVITDGMEAAFTVTYPRQTSGELSLRALYFNGIERMKPGAFIATDENRNGLGAAMLTRVKPTVEIKLPAQASVEVAGKPPATNMASELGNVSSAAPPPRAAPEASAGPGSSWARRLWIGGAVVVVCLIWFGLRAMNRQR